jgi:hypothetical protein
MRKIDFFISYVVYFSFNNWIKHTDYLKFIDSYYYLIIGAYF